MSHLPIDDDSQAGKAARRAVLWLGSSPPPRGLREGITLIESGSDLLSRAAEHERVVLCFGPGASSDTVRTTLEALRSGCPHVAVASVVWGALDLGGYQELVDSDQLFYLTRGELSERDLAAILDSALSPDAGSQVTVDRFLGADTLRRLALAPSLPELVDRLRAAIVKTTGAERGRCLLFDAQRQALWIPSAESNADDGQSAAVGLVSFIVRTGHPVCLPRIGEDPRFDRDLDDPDGELSDRFLGVPVRVRQGEIVAVLVALRRENERAFEPVEIAAMEALAAHCSPYLAAWVGLPAQPAEGDSPFRAQALRELEIPVHSGPEPLRLEWRWARRLSSLVLATLLAALLASVFVKVPEYATGSFVIRGPKVVAFLPARYQSELRPGMKLRLELAGQPYVYRWLPVDAIAAGTIGPDDARRMIGDARHGIDPRSPLVVVTATAPSSRDYANGMQGKAEVRVRSERLLFALFPALEGARK